MLINTIDEIREIYPLNKQTAYASIKPALIQAELQYVRKLMGDAEYDLLDTNFNGGGLTAAQQKIIYFAQSALVNFALYNNLAGLNALIGDLGISELSDSGGTANPVRLWSYKELKTSLGDKADDSGDALLSAMEKQPGQFTLWEASPQFTITKELFINTTEEFSELVNISGSRRTWISIRRFLKQAELKYILPILCQALFDEIKGQILNRSVTADNETLLSMIRPALASYSICEALPNINVRIAFDGILSRSGTDGPGRQASNEQTAELLRHNQVNSGFWSNRLKKHLEDNLDTYPLFRDSDCCNSLVANNRLKDNSGKKSFRV